MLRIRIIDYGFRSGQFEKALSGYFKNHNPDPGPNPEALQIITIRIRNTGNTLVSSAR